VYESGLQHLADNPETYREYPVAEWFFRQLPTVWHETKLLGGYPGQEAVLARRHGNRWFVGGIASGAPRTLKAPLDFLPGNSPWLVELVRDGADGLVIDRQIRSGVDTLDVDVPTNGGFAAVVCRWNPTVNTCR
jgi:alpha-glucosidase